MHLLLNDKPLHIPCKLLRIFCNAPCVNASYILQHKPRKHLHIHVIDVPHVLNLG